MTDHKKPGRVLIIAGSDSGGGAGIQADIKTVTTLGGFAMTAITALTAQNTTGVFGVVPVDTKFIAQQMRVVLEDLGADVLKTGMLHTGSVIETVIEVMEEMAPNLPLIADPVMFAKGGHALLESDAMEVLRDCLVSKAAIVTPNIPEAKALAEMEINNVDDMQRAGEAILKIGARAVLLKGGHMMGDTLVDLLVTHDGFEFFRSKRIKTNHTHGTGCTLSSAVASGLSNGLSLRDAVVSARAYVRSAILAAPEFGSGHGPMDHGHSLRC